jgi:hypothetical protein
MNGDVMLVQSIGWLRQNNENKNGSTKVRFAAHLLREDR